MPTPTEQRPVLQILRTKLEMILEGIALVSLLIHAFVLFVRWGDLPQTTPVHFDIHGTPDGWGSKYLSLIPLGIAFVVYMGLSWLGRVPHYYNYPFRITADNAPRQYLLGRTFLSFIKAKIILVFAYISWMMIATAMGEAAGLHVFLLPIFLIFLFGSIIIYFILSYRAREVR